MSASHTRSLHRSPFIGPGFNLTFPVLCLFVYSARHHRLGPRGQDRKVWVAGTIRWRRVPPACGSSLSVPCLGNAPHSNFGCFYHYFAGALLRSRSFGPSNHCFAEAWQDQHNELPHMHALAQRLEWRHGMWTHLLCNGSSIHIS